LIVQGEGVHLYIGSSQISFTVEGEGVHLHFFIKYFVGLRKRGAEVNVFFLFDWTYGKGEKGRGGGGGGV
jgi:hypothetical protein